MFRTNTDDSQCYYDYCDNFASNVSRSIEAQWAKCNAYLPQFAAKNETLFWPKSCVYEGPKLMKLFTHSVSKIFHTI